MAKPDTGNGWYKLAYELDAALCYADFSAPAQTILRFVRAQTYGMAKLPLASLPIADLASRTGWKRQIIKRAIFELVDSGVLNEEGPDAYRFVKNYEAWTAREKARDLASPKVPRLTPAQLKDARSAPDYAKRRDRAQAVPDGSSAHPDGTASSPRWVSPLNQMGEPSQPDGCDSHPSGSVFHPSGCGPLYEARTVFGEVENKERSNTPQPPDGGHDETPAEKTGFGSPRWLEAEAAKMVLKRTPGDDIIAEAVGKFARGKVAEGYAVADVHASLIAAAGERNSPPKKWAQWVSTNLGTRKVRAEMKAAQIAAEASPAQPQPRRPVKYYEPDEAFIAKMYGEPLSKTGST
jgi:hypothetical protein